MTVFSWTMPWMLPPIPKCCMTTWFLSCTHTFTTSRVYSSKICRSSRHSNDEGIFRAAIWEGGWVASTVTWCGYHKAHVALLDGNHERPLCRNAKDKLWSGVNIVFLHMWSLIMTSKVKELYESLPNRMQAVIAAHGGNTSYWGPELRELHAKVSK